MLAIASLAGGCGPAGSSDGPGDRLRVLAASSLTDVLGEIAERFEESRPDVEVELSFGGSSALVEQLRRGAGADVLITADRRTIERARGANVIDGEVIVIARNRLTLVVEEGNPAGIRGLRDLEGQGLLVVLCAPEVPCGALSGGLLAASGVEVDPASLEENVKGVVSKVAIGEADAGLAYETDARVARRDVDAIAVPLAASERFEAVYPAAIVRDSDRRRLADAFLAHLAGPSSREVLRAAGFRVP